jgi:hypothetical protein
LKIARLPCWVLPVGRHWFLRISVPSGATVRCLKLESAGGAWPGGSAPVLPIAPVSASRRAIWLAHEVTIFPLARTLRFVVAIHAPETFAFSR